MPEEEAESDLEPLLRALSPEELAKRVGPTHEDFRRALAAGRKIREQEEAAEGGFSDPGISFK